MKRSSVGMNAVADGDRMKTNTATAGGRNSGSALPSPPSPPSSPDQHGMKSKSINMTERQKKMFLHPTRINMAGDIEYSEITVQQPKIPPNGQNQSKNPIDIPLSHSLSPLSSVEVRLAKLLQEHPNNQRALILQQKIQERKATAAKRQQQVQNRLQNDPYKSAESLGSMSRIDIQGLYYHSKDDKNKDCDAAEAQHDPNQRPSSLSRPPSSPIRKSPAQHIKYKTSRTSKRTSLQSQSMLQKGKSSMSNGDNQTFLGLLHSIEQEYNVQVANEDKNGTNAFITNAQQQQGQHPEPSSPPRGRKSQTNKLIEKDGPEGNEQRREVERERKPLQRSKSQQESSKKRPRSVSKTRKAPNTCNKVDHNTISSSSTLPNDANANKHRRSRSAGDIECPTTSIVQDFSRPTSTHQPYPSSFTCRNSYRTDDDGTYRSFGGDSSHYDQSMDDSTFGSSRRRRRCLQLPRNHRSAICLGAVVVMLGLVFLTLWILQQYGVVNFLPSSSSSDGDTLDQSPSSSTPTISSNPSEAETDKNADRPESLDNIFPT